MIIRICQFMLLFAVLTGFTFNDEQTENKREKKLGAALKHVWQNPTSVVPMPVSMNDHGMNKFEAVLMNNDTVGMVFSGRVFSCRAGGCSIVKPQHDDAKNTFEGSEYFDMFMIMDRQKQIKRVAVYNYRATHGQEVTAKSWLRQFENYSGNGLTYGKEIDMISGATISAQNLTYEVVRVMNFIKKM